MRQLVLTALASLCLAGSPAVLDDAEPLVRGGTLIPAEAAEIALHFETWTGGLLVAKVLDHGTFVNEGDVIAVLDREPIEKQLHDAELQLESARTGHEVALAQAEIDEAAARATLLRTRESLEDARLALQVWHERELDFRRRQADMSAQATQHGLDDLGDELAQLEAMYREDELTDATEELVLMRSRRNLARAHLAQQLGQDRRRHEETYTIAIQARAKERAVRDKEGELERLVRGHELTRRKREDALRQGADRLHKAERRLAELRHDAERFEIRAPRSGLLLHGGIDAYHPRQVPPRHEHGASLSARSVAFTVMAPDRFAVAVDLPESKLPQVRHAMAVTVKPICRENARFVGRLRLESFPVPASATGPENLYAGRVELDQPLAGYVAGMRVEVTFGEPATDAAGD